MNWYSVRTVVQWGLAETYEERITIWQAASFDRAIELAERETREYATTVAGVYLGLAQAYLIGDELPESGDEVYSLVREFKLDPHQYVASFFATGGERTR